MELSDLIEKVILITTEVGNFIRAESLTFDRERIEYKGLHDMVSYVDKTAEERIITALRNILPDAGFIGEENTNNKIAETYNWIIDPLDGTTNFIHGIPTYAWKDSKAYLNGKEIRVSDNPTLEKSLIATGFPYYDFKRQKDYLALFTEVMQKCHGLRRIGAAAVDLAYTACGRFDAYFEYNLKPWDIAAGILIVKQAGGQVFDFNGGDNALETCDIIATNGKVSGELKEIIKKHFG